MGKILFFACCLLFLCSSLVNAAPPTAITPVNYPDSVDSAGNTHWQSADFDEYPSGACLQGASTARAS